ncbi:hypothetical protein BDZ89DRAFT_1076247, partial [Hymenopellis radicata]
ILAYITGAVSSLWAGCMLRVAVLTRSWPLLMLSGGFVLNQCVFSTTRHFLY